LRPTPYLWEISICEFFCMFFCSLLQCPLSLNNYNPFFFLQPIDGTCSTALNGPFLFSLTSFPELNLWPGEVRPGDEVTLASDKEAGFFTLFAAWTVFGDILFNNYGIIGFEQEACVDFSSSIDKIVSFAQNNPIIVIVLVLCLLFFMYRRPKLFFSLLGLGFLLVGLFYLIMTMAGSASQKKKALTHQEEQSDTNH